MDPLQFFASSGLVIVAGKGGVGKTTVTAAMAIAAARLGRRVLVVELEGASGLGPSLGSDQALGSGTVVLRAVGERGCAGSIEGRMISPGEALTDYLDDHGMRRLSGRLAKAGVIDVVATAAPGLDDILVLGKVKQLERAGEHDLILLDAPAAGHAVTFLRSARGLADAVTVGPIATQANDVLELLQDSTRCQVVLVTLPEETPVNEVVETAFALEESVGVQLGPIVVNGLYPERPGLAAALADEEARSGDEDDGLAARRPLPPGPPGPAGRAGGPAVGAAPAGAGPPARSASATASRVDDVETLADRLVDQLGALAA